MDCQTFRLLVGNTDPLGIGPEVRQLLMQHWDDCPQCEEWVAAHESGATLGVEDEALIRRAVEEQLAYEADNVEP